MPAKLPLPPFPPERITRHAICGAVQEGFKLRVRTRQDQHVANQRFIESPPRGRTHIVEFDFLAGEPSEFGVKAAPDARFDASQAVLQMPPLLSGRCGGNVAHV